MNIDKIYRRYQELQAWVGWTDDCARRVAATAELLAPYFSALVDELHDEIFRHPRVRKVICGGPTQIKFLKDTLIQWLHELVGGCYDCDHVARRWKIGWRHVEVGLDQVYMNVALSQLRLGLMRALYKDWRGGAEELQDTICSLNKLLDLDLAIIEDAYRSEYAIRLQRSERRAAKRRLTRSKERSETVFRTLVEAAPCLIVILRGDGAIVYFSPFAEEVTGYRAEEVLGVIYRERFLDDAWREVVREHLRQVLGGRPARGFENPIRCRDGLQRWFIWNAQRLSDYQGAPAVLKVGQDITALKYAQERTLQAERLAAIGQMMAGLAHESGNALARSQACLEMLALEVEDRTDALDLIGRIQKAQNHLQQLYGEVRNYAAPLKLDRRNQSLRSIWRQAWANLAEQRRGRNASLREECDNVDLHCTVDAFRMEQVFRNILENALAACPDPVEIGIVCSEAQWEDRPALRIAVRDNGPGLEAEQRQRIFEPFFTTKTKGTGLGMAIARRIVEAHGGQISVGTSVGPGAEIQIFLPREIS